MNHPQYDCDLIAKQKEQELALCRQLLEVQGETIKQLAAALAAKDEALALARKELDGLPHSLGYEFTHIPKIDCALAIQPHAELVAKMKAEAVMQAFEWAWSRGTLMPKDGYAYVKRIERGEVE